MLKLKKKVAFELMVKSFGLWNTWGRAQHIAYGLVRGVEYARIEKCANDNPHAVDIVTTLWKLSAWEEHKFVDDGKFRLAPRECYEEVQRLVVWVKKEPRVKKPTDEAAQ